MYLLINLILRLLTSMLSETINMQEIGVELRGYVVVLLFVYLQGKQLWSRQMNS